MEKYKNIPMLRFPEFKEEWRKYSIGEKADIIMGQSPVGDSYNTEGLGEPLINGPVEFTERYPIKIKWTTKPTKFCKKNDILFCVRGSTTGRMNIANDRFCIGRGVAAIRAQKNESTTEFIETIIVKNLEDILTLSAGSTFVNIDSKSIRDFKAYFPSLPEQQKIAAFLTSVDERIAQLTKKKTLLEQYKKGVMQKIFSQEIRFKDDNGKEFGEWEEKKLGDVIIKNSKKNKEEKVKLVKSVSNKFGFVNQEDYFEDRIIASKNLSNYYIIEKGTFAYNPSRINVGSLAYKLDDEICVISPLYISFKPIKEILGLFLLFWFKTERFKMQMDRSFEGSVRNTLSFESLSKITINAPSFSEQTKIANFLSTLDKKIEGVDKQLEQTKLWKKGLLQQMFI